LGVPDDELPHIFDEPYRGQAARGIEGSGLGLALVKAVVEWKVARDSLAALAV